MTDKKYILYDALPEKWRLGTHGNHTLTISMHPCTLDTVRARCPDLHSEPSLGLTFQNAADGGRTVLMEIPSAHRRAKKAWDDLMFRRAAQLHDLLFALYDAPYPDESPRAQLLEIHSMGTARDAKGSLLGFITSPMFREGLAAMYCEHNTAALTDTRTVMHGAYLRGPLEPGTSLAWFDAQVKEPDRLMLSCLHACFFSDPDNGSEYLVAQNMDYPRQLFTILAGLAHIASCM